MPDLEWTSLISTIGFPIAATIAMWKFLTGDFKKSSQDLVSATKENTYELRELRGTIIALLNSKRKTI